MFRRLLLSLTIAVLLSLWTFPLVETSFYRWRDLTPDSFIAGYQFKSGWVKVGEFIDALREVLRRRYAPARP
jgi:hypothetical protein